MIQDFSIDFSYLLKASSLTKNEFIELIPDFKEGFIDNTYYINKVFNSDAKINSMLDEMIEAALIK